MVGKPIPPKPNTPADGAVPQRPEQTRPYGSGAASPRTEPVAPSASREASRILEGTGVDRAAKKRGDQLPGKAPRRLVSLDAFRGFIMIMLAAEGFGIHAFSEIAEDSPVWQTHDRSFWNAIGFHFEHPKEWVSSFEYFKVSFWDLIQPSFMFMVGVSMPFSYARREKLGQGWAGRACHALIRSVVLVLMGVFLYSMGHLRTNWIFPNVLCQIGLGYFFAWLLLNRHRGLQFAALGIILIGYWGWFRMNPPPENYDYAAVKASQENGEILEGSFAAWSKNSNAAFLFDQWLLPTLRTVPVEEAVAAAPAVNGSDETNVIDGTEATMEGAVEAVPVIDDKRPGWFRQWFLSNPEPYTFNGGGYTTLNFIPSIGTSLLGILCGQLLIAPGYSKWSRLGILLLGAAVCLGLGILADITICPVIKRIWTPSWVLFSGGYVIGLLALFYLVFDIAPLKLLAFPLVVVGMNSILIYLLGETLGGWMREDVVKVHFAGMIGQIFGPNAFDPLWYESVTLSTGAVVLFWLLLLWLYRQRIFLRI